ncbi:hypothetical protein COCSADRAFT_30978 [Bipolaris sorokiniana ND90Pr]|uniref:Uncharacterized protein n=1 Tax=Cochliobolus sativus (strain ND90Pr / ATCC 201652) TaxID=665912 RepID=M2SPX6_COCSN|nr:uncharacterized protein COCSADRAFT_30978 [Bipolaris sorokiniana ND90Pr]EMD58822.1 hypothetical protein COCSADRAFT_30978 [Bipolaris sorokiniana ND90Pr]
MGLSPIEQLPVELLQHIFIESGCSFTLLQTSPYIATRLSSEYAYNCTCDYYLTEVHGEHGKQSVAQTYIFATKWMTWDFFKSWCLRRFGARGCLCDRKPEEGCFDAQWPPNFHDATTMVFSRSHLPRLAFVKGRLPKKLLQGPWNPDKIEFLRFLLWTTSMNVDWCNPDMAQLAVQGRLQAMKERNLEAVELFNNNRRLGKPPNLETVHFAVVEAGCDRSIVYDTLEGANMWNRSTDPHYAEALHRWCDEQVAAGSQKGLWLRKKLEESLVLRKGDITNEYDSGKTYPRKSCLTTETEDYDGGPDDQLIVNELEWNKVIPQRGWLIARATGYNYQTINHNLSWPEITRNPGYRMYRGPNSPRRLQCWVEHSGASRIIDLWLSPPASCESTPELRQRRTSFKYTS